MIKLTRYDNKEFFVNAELIQFVESKPDTIITLISGEKIIVKESLNEVIDKIIHYKQIIHQAPLTTERD
ncbi:MAG: flagellar FlbD family protein [Candidatus Omnitrophica bacterium]|nr:flagellar FlbD family protein [Candidatus Omnitrophota bacterium]